MVEQGGADEVALLQTLIIEGELIGGALTAIDHDLGAGLHALADVVADPLQSRAGDQWPVIGLGVQTVPHAQLIDTVNKLGAQTVCGFLAHRDGDTDRHAALTGAAVARADQRVDGLVQVGVGHDDHVVFGATKALCALPVRGRGGVDVLRDVRAADEADGLDVGVGEDGVDRLLVALDHLEDARGQAGLDEQLGQPQRHRRIALRRLEDERITACECRAGLPQRDHGREVERGDTGDDTERLADRIHIDPGARALGELALEQVRDADGEFDHLDAALDVAQ